MEIFISIEKQDNLEVAYELYNSAILNPLNIKNGNENKSGNNGNNGNNGNKDENIHKNGKNPYQKFNKNNHEKYDTGSFSNQIKNELANKCWNKIDNAVKLGRNKLLNRHEETFSNMIDRVSLNVGSIPGINSGISSGSGSGSGPGSGFILDQGGMSGVV